jgi:hypothetical protein
MNKLVRAVFISCLIFLAGCQSSQSVLDGVDGIEIPLTASSDTYGDGKTLVGVILPASVSGQASSRSQEYLDGAKLGVDLLGQNQFKLLIQRTDGTPESSLEAATKISEAGASIVMGPIDKANIAAAKSGLKTVPMIAFADNSMSTIGGVYPFLNDPILGVNEAIRATAVSKKNNFLILQSSNVSSGSLKRVTSEITRRKAKLQGTYPYNGNTKRTYDSIKKHIKTISSADIVVILGNSEDVKAVLDAFTKHKIRTEKTNIIEVRDQHQKLAADVSFQGVIFAKLPNASLSRISKAYITKFGRPASQASAYGFDVMAMIAGLQRSKQLGKKTDAGITDSVGFRALNGYFRFHKGGRLERRHQIHQINNKAVVLIQELGEGF